MKIVLVLEHSGVGPFLPALRELHDRGHTIEVAVRRVKTGRTHELLQELADDCERITYSRLPPARSDWARAARSLRFGIDYLRYLEPRYRAAPKLRARAEARAPAAIVRAGRAAGLAGTAGVVALRRGLQLVERCVPPPPAAERFLAQEAPDVVLVTPLVDLGSRQADWLRAAKRRGIRTGYPVFSWDNLTNKGLLRDVPELVLVWNDLQAREAEELHGVPRSRIRLTGAPVCDPWFGREPSRSREDFCREVGLRADRPIVLYVCSSEFVAPNEVGFVRGWVDRVRARGGLLAEAGILIRPYPDTAQHWAGWGDEEQVAVWPRFGEGPHDEASRRNYYDSIHHSAAVIGINTTAQIEAAIVGRPVHTLLADEYRATQEGTLHFHYLEDGDFGLLHVGRTFDEHARMLEESLRGEGDDGRNERFLRRFVRPLGLDRPATGEVVAAIEALGARPGAGARPRAGRRAARPAGARRPVPPGRPGRSARRREPTRRRSASSGARSAGSGAARRTHRCSPGRGSRTRSASSSTGSPSSAGSRRARSACGTASTSPAGPPAAPGMPGSVPRWSRRPRPARPPAGSAWSPARPRSSPRPTCRASGTSLPARIPPAGSGTGWSSMRRPRRRLRPRGFRMRSSRRSPRRSSPPPSPSAGRSSSSTTSTVQPRRPSSPARAASSVPTASRRTSRSSSDGRRSSSPPRAPPPTTCSSRARSLRGLRSGPCTCSSRRDPQPGRSSSSTRPPPRSRPSSMARLRARAWRRGKEAGPAGERPAWAALDEEEEYRELCRVRLESAVPVREPLVLISQIQRSGGTLLSQLLDGHPECHAHPQEIYIGKPAKWDWPPLDLAAPETWFETLHEPLVADWLRAGYVKDETTRRKGASPDVFPFVFSPRLQKAIFDADVAARAPESERDLLDAYFTSFFNAWLDNQNLYTGPKKAVTGFTPRLAMELDRVERLFAAYPDGMLVSIVRDPRGWYASASKHRKYYRDVDEALGLWRRSAEATLAAADRFGERVAVLTYERLAGDPEATVRSLVRRIGLEWAPGLLVPTFNGRPIRANSSYGAERTGILGRQTTAYRDVLDAGTIARIDELGGDLYEQADRSRGGDGRLTERRLKVLFFAGGPRFYLRQFSSLVGELAARGHEVHVAFQPAKGDLDAPPPTPGVTHGLAPERAQADGWRPVAWMVRALEDLARYAHPRYARAPDLRGRMEKKILGHLTKSPDFEPVGRSLALRVGRRLAAGPDARLSERVIRAASRLEEGIPTSPVIDAYIRQQAPDVVLATPVVNRASTQVDLLKSARRLGIPAATCVASWDNLTNKGLLKFTPERVIVWNEIQRREAVELHGIPAGRVVTTGAQLFDSWFERRPSTTREQFTARIGLDPARPYVLYTCSNPAMTDLPERDFVLDWVRALRGSADPRLAGIGIAVRPHPNEAGEWADVDLGGVENVAIWPRAGELPVTDEARAGFFDSLAHSAAVVGINTTAMIEAAIVGKSVLTVLSPEFAQESTLHFDYLLEANGGFLHVATSLDEHLAQLATVLDEDAEGAERRRLFVESFVRPHGLDRPATPIFADAVEELAALPVQPQPRVPVRHALLAIEAALTARTLRRRQAGQP